MSQIKHIRSVLLISLTFISLLTIFNPQLLQIDEATAWTSTYPDTYVENGSTMDSPHIFYGGSSWSNINPLNVSTTNADFYRITVPKGNIIRVDIEFDPAFLYNESIFVTEYKANLDLYLLFNNGSVASYSNYSGSLESVGPFYVEETDNYFIHVEAYTLPWFPQHYSTLYNMTIVIDDIYEGLEKNDKMADLWTDGPTPIRSSDNEIVPGYYKYLFLTAPSRYDFYFLYLEEDSYLTVDANSSSSDLEVDLIVPDSDFVKLDYAAYGNVGSGLTSLSYTAEETGFYYLRIYEGDFEVSLHYTLEIDIKDQYDLGEKPNENRDLAVLLDLGDDSVFYENGLTIEDNDSDWFMFKVHQGQKVLVTIDYLYNIDDIIVAMYDSYTSANETISPIRIGDYRYTLGPYFATTDGEYYLVVNSTREYSAYYSLTVEVVGPDDIYEDNDRLTDPVLMPTESYEYKPTEKNPLGGMIILRTSPSYVDTDNYAFALLPGDVLDVTITFNATAADINLAIYNSTYGVVSSSTSPTSGRERVSTVATKSEVFIVRVFAHPSAFVEDVVPYNMSVVIDEADDIFEPNDVYADAAAIAEGNFTDLISRTGDYDWYYIYLRDGDIVNISLNYFAEFQEEGDPNDLELDLLFNDQSLAARSHTLQNESINYVVEETGSYFIVTHLIVGYSNYYNLTINVIETDDIWEDNDFFGEAKALQFPGNPLNSSVTNGYEGFKIRVRDDDWYKVQVPTGLALIVEMTMAANRDIDIELYNQTGFLLDSSMEPAGSAEQVGPIAFNISNSGYAYIRIYMLTDDYAEYDLEITIGPKEYLFPLETETPFTSTPPSITSPGFDWGLVAGGAILLGGGGAGVYLLGTKTAVGGKAVGAMKDRFANSRFGKGGGRGSSPKVGKSGPKLTKKIKDP